MKNLVILTLSLVLGGSSALANEQYQMTNAIGVWKASWGSAFSYFDLLITPSADGKSLKVEHYTLDIEFSGTCTPYDNIIGTGTYSPATESIQITESNSSPTPAYDIKVDPKQSDKLSRSWGTQIINYFKMN